MTNVVKDEPNDAEDVRVEDFASLTYIPSANQIMYLKKLNLANANLEALPESIGLLTELQLLNLMSNKLTKLPDSIGNLSKVTLLGLKSNKLVELPETIGGMRSLTELYLTDNNLTSLPDGFSCLTSLVKLQASFNAFDALPPALASLPRLEMMRLACCNIGTVSAELLKKPGAFPALAWVSLAGNPCCHMPSLEDVLQSVPKLTRSEIQVGGLLGSGASGEVFAVDGLSPSPAFGNETSLLLPPPEDLAVKFFIGSCNGGSGVSPDGQLDDEVVVTIALGGGRRFNSRGRATTANVDSRDSNDRLGGKQHQGPLPKEKNPDDSRFLDVLDASASVQCVLAAVVSSDDADAARSGNNHGDAVAVPRRVEGLIFRRFQGHPLAFKPTSAHLLRCRWPEGSAFASELTPVCLVERLAAALGHCHLSAGDKAAEGEEAEDVMDVRRGIRFCHGDIYAHNVLAASSLMPISADEEKGVTTTDEKERDSALLSVLQAPILLCDFGASFPYPEFTPTPGSNEGVSSSDSSTSDPPRLSPSPCPAFFFWEAVEVRAFGLLLKDLANRAPSKDKCAGSKDFLLDPKSSTDPVRTALLDLAAECVSPDVWGRPSFSEIRLRLSEIRRGLSMVVE